MQGRFPAWYRRVSGLAEHAKDLIQRSIAVQACVGSLLNDADLDIITLADLLHIGQGRGEVRSDHQAVDLIDIISCSSSEIEKRYGFIYVDYDNQFNGTGKRSLKDSYYWYKKVTASNGEDLG